MVGSSAGFYDISIIIVNLMQNPVYSDIKYMILKQIVSRQDF